MKKKDCFAVLELSDKASEAEIKKAYWNLAKRYHPDVNKEPGAHERFIAINEAYEYLLSLSPSDLFYNADDETYTEEERTYFDTYQQKVRQRAEQKAQMRYQEFLRQEQAYKESGLYDAGILLKIVFHFTLFPLTIFLFAGPFLLEFKNSDAQFTFLIFGYALAIFLILYVAFNTKHFFTFDTLYYTPKRIAQIFRHTQPSDVECWYTKNMHANAKPYLIELLLLKDIRLKSNGFRQHQANYIDESAKIAVPRSQKAFIVHAYVIAIKMVALLACLLFFPCTSMVWRFVFGLIIGFLISQTVLWINNTKSSVSYLLTVDLLIRFGLWFCLLVSISDFNISPFDVRTHSFIYFLVVVMVLFDCLIMQFNSMILGNKAFKPLLKQYKPVEERAKTAYKLYEDIPVVSFLYPLLKWIVG